MDLFEYVPLAIRTEKPLNKIDRLVHGCMGLITEIGEVTTELKRMAIYGKPLDDDRKKHILEEVGDVMWYAAIILDATKLPLDFLDFLKPAPNMEELGQDDKGFFEATALMIGSNCGQVCEFVQDLEMGIVGFRSNAQFVASLGMIIIGMKLLANACGSTLEQAMKDNIAKLQIRYPEKYTNEAAESRADKAGADARNS